MSATSTTFIGMQKNELVCNLDMEQEFDLSKPK